MTVQRAAVLIGVDATGQLPKLHDAAAGARRMEQWALAQGIERDMVHVVTDEGGPVDVGAIKRAIRAVVEPGTVSQLLVYFAGHGINLGMSEYWLLSDAPADPDAAVNLKGSMELAACSTVPHVVFISDACRTLPPTMQLANVKGSHIFPNDVGPERPVDAFFACTVGSPALELRDPAAAAADFKAVYTAALVEALQGRVPAVVEQRVEDGRTLGLVRPKPLGDFLATEVPRRLADVRTAGADGAAALPPVQVPFARVYSHDTWLARFERAERVVRRGGAAPRPRLPAIDAPANAHTIARGMVVDALSGSATRRTAGDGSLVEAAERAARASVPRRLRTQPGFAVSGALLVDAVAAGTHVEPVGGDGSFVPVPEPRPPATNVLLTFGDGSGVLAPAIPRHVGTLDFVDGELLTIGYDPSTGSPGWVEFEARAGEVRRLRTLAGAAMRLGALQLDEADALALAHWMRRTRWPDPTMATYAAYAFHELRRRDLLLETHRALQASLGFRLFDLALLAGELDGRAVAGERDVLPPIPLLAQGWALLAVRDVRLPPSLAAVRQHLEPSAWSVLAPAGVRLARAAISSDELP